MSRLLAFIKSAQLHSVDSRWHIAVCKSKSDWISDEGLYLTTITRTATWLLLEFAIYYDKTSLWYRLPSCLNRKCARLRPRTSLCGDDGLCAELQPTVIYKARICQLSLLDLLDFEVISSNAESGEPGACTKATESGEMCLSFKAETLDCP
jgi:hypothetical protein